MNNQLICAEFDNVGFYSIHTEKKKIDRPNIQIRGRNKTLTIKVSDIKHKQWKWITERNVAVWKWRQLKWIGTFGAPYWTVAYKNLCLILKTYMLYEQQSARDEKKPSKIRQKSTSIRFCAALKKCPSTKISIIIIYSNRNKVDVAIYSVYIVHIKSPYHWI